MPRTDRSPAEMLNDYWNRWDRDSAGLAVAPPTPLLDPSLVATLEELYARDDARRPAPHVLDRVEQALVAEAPRTAGRPSPLPLAVIWPPGHAAPAPPTPRVPKRAGGWGLHHLATAALIALTLLSSLVALHGPLRPTAQDDRDRHGMPRDETPETALLPGDVQETTLLHGTFDTFPTYAAWEGIARATLAPGTAFDLGKSKNDGEGPLLYLVQFGELTVTADGPISVTRAGSDQPTTIPAGQEVVLREGDQGFAPSGVASRWRNDRQVPTIVLDAGITTTGIGTLPRGVSHEPIVATYATAPRQPVAVAVRRVTLSPSTLLALDDVPGLQLLYLESGEIQVITRDNLALAANPLQTNLPTKGVRIVTGGPVFDGTVPKGYGVRVAETGPATLLMFIVTNQGASGGAPMG